MGSAVAARDPDEGHTAVRDPVGGIMFYCERCGTSFNAAAAGMPMACPRCRGRDGVYSPLTFQLFDPAARRLRRKGAGEAKPERG
jgi:hypothetical protein